MVSVRTGASWGNGVLGRQRLGEDDRFLGRRDLTFYGFSVSEKKTKWAVLETIGNAAVRSLSTERKASLSLLTNIFDRDNLFLGVYLSLCWRSLLVLTPIFLAYPFVLTDGSR